MIDHSLTIRATAITQSQGDGIVAVFVYHRDAIIATFVVDDPIDDQLAEFATTGVTVIGIIPFIRIS